MLRERGREPYRLRPDQEQNAWIAVVIEPGARGLIFSAIRADFDR